MWKTNMRKEEACSWVHAHAANRPLRSIHLGPAGPAHCHTGAVGWKVQRRTNLWWLLLTGPHWLQWLKPPAVHACKAAGDRVPVQENVRFAPVGMCVRLGEFDSGRTSGCSCKRVLVQAGSRASGCSCTPFFTVWAHVWVYKSERVWGELLHHDRPRDNERRTRTHKHTHTLATPCCLLRTPRREDGIRRADMTHKFVNPHHISLVLSYKG